MGFYLHALTQAARSYALLAKLMTWYWYYKSIEQRNHESIWLHSQVGFRVKPDFKTAIFEAVHNWNPKPSISSTAMLAV